MDVVYGTPTGLYVIVEQIHSKSGMPSFGNTTGPSLYQIYRTVLQLHELNDTYVGGERLDFASMSTWQMIKGTLGIDMVTMPNSRHTFKLEYAGYTNEIQPLPKIGDILPDALTRTYSFNTSSPYIFGKDPIPQIRLYKNPNAIFLQSNGGASAATSVAKYNAVKKDLIILNTLQEIERALNELKSQNPLPSF